MARFRIILSAGVCAVALSGCIPAAAGLALSAANLVTGGGGGKGGDSFRNPIDRHTTGRQIRQALSRLNDQVDPACQTILDEHLRTHGTLTVGAPATASGAAPAKELAGRQSTPIAAENTQNPPKNLLARLGPQLEETGPAVDVAVSADSSAANPAAARDDTQSTPGATPDGGAAAAPAETAPSDPQPVKASLGQPATSGPGQCEHRWACLPGTPQPTVMLMCPGKGGGAPGSDATVAADAPGSAESADTKASPPQEQDTAALQPDASGSVAGAAPTTDAPASSEQAAAPASAPAKPSIEGGGVADWNWSYDPSKRY